MPAGSASSSTSLSITNPLVLYRALVTTNKIRPDPAQHRLALHLQKLYFRLKDYSPELEYRHRLDQIARAVPHVQSQFQHTRTGDNESEQRNEDPLPSPSSSSSYLRSLFRRSAPSSVLALTRTAAMHDSAVNISSPQGLLLYGEVGRGKSMLLDLLYTALPSRQKRRWHFNTFMLDVFRRLKRERIFRSSSTAFGRGLEHEHVVLSLAKDTVATSPILFLDEFQMPDRATSKLVNGFMTAFFHLGGVLVASSNRMPDELAKASGVEFGGGRGSVFGWGLRRNNAGEQAAKSDFGLFLEVLKARCEVWEMEGEKDWRREGEDVTGNDLETKLVEDNLVKVNEEKAGTLPTPSILSADPPEAISSDTPRHYHIITSPALPNTLLSLNPTQSWHPTTLHIYSRALLLPTTNLSLGLLLSSFSSLCASNLGPADYITLCSHFHTIILTNVPVLTTLMKNEARRFITLLDALYEARCRLVIEAAAPPDKLFFPETRRSTSSGLLESAEDPQSTASPGNTHESDAIASEAFSEMYQDSTAPFRPNVSMYDERDHSAQPTMSLHNRNLRSVLPDEDADFGPTYGNGRSHGASADSRARQGFGVGGTVSSTVDFTDVGVLTGEDERFAYKRARSRLWEMCGRKWWREREGRDVDEWWRPVVREGEGRFWEGTGTVAAAGFAAVGLKEVARQGTSGVMPDGSHDGRKRKGDSEKDAESGEADTLFRHGASPYRTVAEAPPKFGWEHAWGMVRWGKRAGEWGKGVEGEGRRERRSREETKEDEGHK